MFPYKVRKVLITTKYYFLIVFSVIVAAVIFLFLILSLKNYQIVQEEISTVSAETEKLKTRVDTLKKGKTLVENEIDEINQLFSILIPDSEDFFSIIYALEKISQETGFAIEEYSLGFGTNAEKTPITINGTGDIDSFMNFLKSYQFAGGRFATSESINFSNAKFSSTQVVLNFYSKKVSVDTETAPIITDKDTNFIKKIKAKIKIKFKDKTNEVPLKEDYDTKTNPFAGQTVLPAASPTLSPILSPSAPASSSPEITP